MDPSLKQAPKTQAITRLHERPPSFTDLLPWSTYDQDSKLFVLDDGISLGAFFELFPVSSEAVDSEYLEEIRDLLQIALVDALPEDEKHPWVLQLFVQDDFDFEEFRTQVSDYRKDAPVNNEFRQHFDATFQQHLSRFTQEQGLFVEDTDSQRPWRGRIRRIRATLYQRQSSVNDLTEHAEQHVIDVMTRFRSAMAVAGVASEQLDLAAFRNWLVPWFNPCPSNLKAGHIDLKHYFTRVPDPMPINYDVAQDLCLSQPESDAESGTWWFDGLPHEVISVQGFRRTPNPGHLSAEQHQGERTSTFLDEVPLGTITALTIEVLPESAVSKQIAQVKKSAVGDGAESQATREQVEQVEREVVHGNKLFHVSLAFYLRGLSHDDLKDRRNQLTTQLLANGIQPIATESDLLKLDSYLRNLPMGFDPKLNTIRRRSKLMFGRDLAGLIPVYGRSRGKGHPGFVFFNRGAEPLCFDPLNALDRKKNGHLLVLGPTGSGKSATLTYLLQQVMARHRPRLYIIEAGGSFELLAQYFQGHGLVVNQVTLRPDCEVSLPPFIAASELHRKDSLETGRDRLSELEIIAKIMVTGGDANELNRLTRADQLMIRTALLHSPSLVKESNGHQVLTETVVAALRQMSQDDSLDLSRRSRATAMADSMALFCSGVAGHFFNRPGTPWPEADVTLLEMGLLARDGYEDQLSVAYLSLMSHIHNSVEANQHDQRQTLVVTDEGHVILTHPLLSNYIVKITKMWRKYGAWFWLATQNLADFPEESKRMLSMIEWWLCLAMSKDEVEQLERFRDITLPQRRLLLSARKEPGKYVEGVVFSDDFEALFRNVPPALSLALAQSEKHEKARRRALMNEHDCSEYEAAQMIADEIIKSP